MLCISADMIDLNGVQFFIPVKITIVVATPPTLNLIIMDLYGQY